MLISNITVYSSPAGEEVVLLSHLWPRLLVHIIVVGVPLNVTLLDETHRLCLQSPLILLGLHLLSEDVSVYVVGRKSLLLKPVIAIVKVSHEVTIVIIDKVSTLTSV